MCVALAIAVAAIIGMLWYSDAAFQGMLRGLHLPQWPMFALSAIATAAVGAGQYCSHVIRKD